MNKRHRPVGQIGLGLALCAMAGWIVWRAWQNREPTYQGKTLVAWLQSLNDPPGSGPPGNDELRMLYGGWNSGWTKEKGELVKRALEHMGPRALPALRAMIRFRETPLRLKLKELVVKQRVVRFHFRSESEIHQEAAAGCQLADPAVKTPLITDWIQLLQDKENDEAKDPSRSAKSLDDVHEASFCLTRASSNLGPEACRPLLEALAKGGTQLRRCAAATLRQFPSQGKIVAPALLASLRNDPDSGVRYNAALALGHMQPEAQTVVPALLSEVTNPASRVRVTSIWPLSQFTNQAPLIVPVLKTARTDSDPALRSAVTNALDRLIPQTNAK